MNSPPGLRENFEKFGHLLPITRQLVTLKNDVEMEFDPEVCKNVGLNAEGMRPHLEELGFESLLRKVNRTSIAEKPAKARPMVFEENLSRPGQRRGAKSRSRRRHRGRLPLPARLHRAEFEELLAGLARKRFAFDTETNALGAMNSELVGMVLAGNRMTGITCRCADPRDARSCRASGCWRCCGRSLRIRLSARSGTT